jgi:glycosyltransferase involved in cell wall biosynthesis
LVLVELISGERMSKSAGRRQWDAEITMTPVAAAAFDAKQLTDPYSAAPVDLTLFVSCYNEAIYIVETLDTVCAAAKAAGIGIEIIVIDDGSRDDSVAVVQGYITAHPDVCIVLRANHVNKGLAQNFVDGAFLGRGKYYRLICGDHSETLESLTRIFAAVGRADMLIPYYTWSEGKGFVREMISRTYTWLINTLTGNKLRYYNGCPVHLRFNVLRWHPNTRGFGFQAELNCLLIDLGFTYEEIEFTVIERRVGRSNALTFKNLMSVIHTIAEIFARRLSRMIYGGFRVVR